MYSVCQCVSSVQLLDVVIQSVDQILLTRSQRVDTPSDLTHRVSTHYYINRDTDPTITLLPHSLYLYSTCDREVDRAVGLLGTSAHYTCYHYMLSLCQCCCCCCSCCYCCCCCYCYLLHSLYLQSVLLYRTPTSYSSLYLAQVMCYSYSLSPTTRSPTHLSTVSLLLVLVILLLPKIPQQVTTPSHYYC